MGNLNTLFNHKNWFVKRNQITNEYEPYLTKKLALQYFASSGDFINDNSVLRYTGKEKGSYRMNQTESSYYADLEKQIKDAKAEGSKYFSLLKMAVSKDNTREVKHVIFKNTLITVIAYFNSDYHTVNVSFLDYIRENGGDTKEILKTLEK